MIYTVGGIKGGSGKTTVATNLAVLLNHAGRDVLLVDADDQESATDFTTWRSETLLGNVGYTAVQLSGVNVRREVAALAKKYSDVVIDVGGRDTTSQRAALSVANVALFPFVPRSLDVWTLEKLARLIDEITPANPDLKCFAFINRADHAGQDNLGAETAIREARQLTLLDVQLRTRKAFANAAAQGLAVSEVRPVDTKAVQEFNALFAAVTGLERRLHSAPISASAAAPLRTIRLRVPEDCEWVFPGETQGKPLQKHGAKKWEPVFGNGHAAINGTSSGSGKMSGRRPNCPPSASMTFATPSRPCSFRAA